MPLVASALVDAWLLKSGPKTLLGRSIPYIGIGCSHSIIACVITALGMVRTKTQDIVSSISKLLMTKRCNQGLFWGYCGTGAAQKPAKMPSWLQALPNLLDTNNPNRLSSLNRDTDHKTLYMGG